MVLEQDKGGLKWRVREDDREKCREGKTQSVIDTNSPQLVGQVLGGLLVPWWYEPPMFLGNRNWK